MSGFVLYKKNSLNVSWRVLIRVKVSVFMPFAKSTLSIHNLSSQRVIPPNSVLTQKMGNGNYVSVPITTIKSPA